jgi:hypothetical protein
MKKKFIIFSPSYNETSGGIVVLHKLCHVLNELGHDSYVKPYAYNYEVNATNWKRFLYNLLKWSLFSSIKPFKVNPAFNTPVYNGSDVDDSWIVIYPEVVFGNPMNAKNVVRWLLHQPGYHEGKVFYGKNEIYFKFNSAIENFSFPGSNTSKNELKVIHYPLEHYNLHNISDERKGSAYCLRKGKGKTIAHDLSDSVLIDGMSHAEVSKIFKKVKTFISYDTYTAYSIFAVLCGCESVVIPDMGVTVEEWYPKASDRYGIAYGFENISKAVATAHLVKEHIYKEDAAVLQLVEVFSNECNEYFFKKK